MSVATFQIFSDGKIKPITKHQYMRRIDRKGYTVGYTDGDWVLFTKNHEVIVLTHAKFEQILSLPLEEKLP